MKKIVALVLSLVMVLGLATTAFAANTTYEGLTAKKADGNDFGTAGEIVLTVRDTVAPKYNDNGVLIDWGAVGYATISGGAAKYVVVDSLSELVAANDFVLYTDTACKYPAFYLQKVDVVAYAEGVAFDNFGKACGEVKYADYDATKDYYTAKGASDIYVAAKDGDKLLKVGAEYVLVKDINKDVTDVEAHVAMMTNKDGKTIAVKCSKCGLEALQVANKLALPEKTPAIDGTLNTVWYWPAAAQAPAAGETVESAKTFDAGIAMYVGMSVMAAAGSAVVLKKKD